MNNQCEGCGCNINDMCVVAFMPIDRVMSYLGECECRIRKLKRNFPSVIGFAGYARVGKDTCADFAKEWLPEDYSRSSFANRLKRECGLMLSAVTEDSPNLLLTENKIKYREFLVFWGRHRRKAQPDYWIENLEDENSNPVSSKTVISDVRYPNEAQWIRKRGGVVVLVERPNVGPANEEEKQSIQTIVSERYYDYALLNDGSLDDLKEKVAKLIAEMIIVHKGFS